MFKQNYLHERESQEESTKSEESWCGRKWSFQLVIQANKGKKEILKRRNQVLLRTRMTLFCFPDMLVTYIIGLNEHIEN